MYVIVGLGNPGKRYERTRHNIGFQAVEKIAEAWKISVRKETARSLIGTGTWQGESVLLALPQTYMNSSGEAVNRLVQQNRTELEKLLVICDDLALPVGYARLRAQGREGGHQGLADIMRRLGTQQFNRLRLGIGELIHGMDASQYVLERFTNQENEKLEAVLNRVPGICEVWIRQGVQKAMSCINVRIKKES